MIAVIILAAGSSSRMGQPKQLLSYSGKTLLNRAIDHALDLEDVSVYIVLGANAELIAPTIQSKKVTIVKNQDWASGMSSSIKTGLFRALKDPSNWMGVLVMLVDQPKVTSTYLHKIINKAKEQSSSIIASGYSSEVGVPAYFSKTHFDDLLQLEGHAGARFLLKRFKKQTEVLEFPEGAIDLDTPTDWTQWLNKQ